MGAERVAVVGCGQTRHQATRGDVSIAGLVREAAMRALEDAGMTWSDIDAVVVGKAPDFFEGLMMPELYLAEALGAVGKPLLRVHTAGSVGGSTAIVASSLVSSGIHKRVLTVAFEKQSESEAMWALSLPVPFSQKLVAGAGGFFAPHIRAYMRRSGAPDDTGILVALKDRLKEDGFGATPDEVAANVTKCIATGVAGLSIEDSPQGEPPRLYEFDEALARFKAARAAVDKAGGDAQYDPLGSLYTLLEHDTAAEFIDEFAEVPIDASDVVWIATANDARSIPEPILNRMNVYAIEAPDEEGARRIAASIYEELRNEHAWGRVFPRELGGESLDRLGRMKPREMRRMMLAAFGNAKLAGRNEVLPEDFTDERVAKKARIGF